METGYDLETYGATAGRDMTAGSPETRARLALDPNMDLTDAQFMAITRRIHRDTGIVIGTTKRSMLVSRLAHRLRSLSLPDFESYAKLLDTAEGEAERQALVSAITTNVTRFFREPHHFEALAEMVPTLMNKVRSGGRVRLWSAGCSTGEEAYSIAATLVDVAPEVVQHDVRILATDIDPKVIETARRGIYDPRNVGSDLPAVMRRHIVDAPGGQLAISPKIAALIRFEQLNLIETWPFKGQFDIIFCRNVVIYFDADTRHVLWQRYAGRIVTGGKLFIGHSERMDPRLDPFFKPSGITCYRRTDLAMNVDAAQSLAMPQPARIQPCL